MRSREQLSSLLLGCILFSVGLASQQAYKYEPVGPKETEQLERRLRNKLTGYDSAFWPRPERLKDAVPGRLLPKAYTGNIRKWLPRVLDPALMPTELDPNGWIGVRKLYVDKNFILGRFSSATDPNTVIEFKGAYRNLNITVSSKGLFAKSAASMTTEGIRDVLTTVLRIPADKIDKMEFRNQAEKLAGVDVYYGKMWCEWSESSDPFTSVRQWWSYIPFWYTQGMLYVGVTTVEEGDRPHPTMEERWPF